MVTILANGMAGNAEITSAGADYDAFCAALSAVTQHLSRSIAADGEGATKLIICKLTGASDKAAAIKLSKSVINSPLVKCAMFGADANWGRVLCALGYAGVPTDVNQSALRSPPRGFHHGLPNGLAWILRRSREKGAQ
jgi:glutamate N-acetyltransferase/amino-acid N-acetyltransferase